MGGSDGLYRDPRGALRYAAAGLQGHWVVFCHALGTSGALWAGQVAALQGAWRTLAFDLRGHGGSPPPADGDYSFAALAADVVALMDHVGARTASVVGISVGGEVAQVLAATYPERVERLLLVSTACVTSPERAALWTARIAEAEREGMAPAADAAARRWFTPEFQAAAPATVEGWRAAVARTTVCGYIGIARTIQAMDLRPAIRAIACPTRILVGDRDPATGPAVGQEIAAAIPGATLRVIEGAGHLWNLERADRFNDELRAWLRDD